MHEHEVDLVKLYKEGKITEYVFQQEMSNFMGSMSEVKVYSESKANTVSTFGIFIIPEIHINGIKIVYLVDKNAIFNLYTEQELIERLDLIRTKKQVVIREIFTFNKTHETSFVSLGEAVACYLRIYEIALPMLRKANSDFIPTEKEIDDAILNLSSGNSVEEIIESLSLKNILTAPVIAAAKGLAHLPEGLSASSSVKFGDPSSIPTMNLGQQEIRSLCDGTFSREHKEIKFDYLPNTNQ